MKNIYLVKENPKAEKESVKWIEMTRAEFGVFIKSKAAEGRFFARLPKDLGQEGDNIIYEVSKEQYVEWRAEKRHVQYLRDLESEMGYKIVSYSKTSSEDNYCEDQIESNGYDLLSEIISDLEIESLQQVLRNLSKDEYQLIKDLYLLEKPLTVRELGEKNGVHFVTISKRKNRILAKIKAMLE